MAFGQVNVPGVSGAESAEAKRLAEEARKTAEQAAQAVADIQEKVDSGEIGGGALNGTETPTDSTQAAVGQKYLNAATGEEWTCLAVKEDGKRVWGVPVNLAAKEYVDARLGDVAAVLEKVVGSP